MIRYSQLYPLHHVTVLDCHPFTPGSTHDQVQSALHTTSCYYTWFSSLHSCMDQRLRPWSGTDNCSPLNFFLYLISSLHSWIKTQTMIRYSQLYTLHHVTVLDFHPLQSWIKTQTMFRNSQLHTLHHVTVLDFHPFTPGSRPDHVNTSSCYWTGFHPFTHGPWSRPWSGTVNCRHFIMLLNWISSLHSWPMIQTLIRYF